MASVQIPNPGWTGLLTRLGIQRFGSFFLGETVVPVALVDASAVQLSAVASMPLFGTPASAGEIVNPAANTRLADTLALAAGPWSVLAVISHGDAAGVAVRVRRRNAADVADVWTQWIAMAGTGAGFKPVFWAGRFSFAQGERLVVENTAIGAGIYQASIFALAG